MNDVTAEQVSLTSTDVDYVHMLQFTAASTRNAFTVPLLRQMLEALAAIKRRPPRVLILCGRVECFSSGLDLSTVSGMGETEFQEMLDLEYSIMRELDHLPLVTIAALSGPCIGNAAEFALACDYRVTTRTLKFGFPEVAVGFMGPSQRLIRTVGFVRAKHMLFESRVVGADDALSWGLVDRVSNTDSPVPPAMETAAQMARLAPRAIALTKDRLLAAAHSDERLDEGEKAAALESFRTRDVREGLTAFLERRAPVFVGE